ncbi:Ig-like domain-containing protein [Mesorhizobium sp. SP-1A]|uniref:Ig-like domain-containing protein n=1 Tax=Mesorhizobium sp. SP-1A TaxID=3077840 RepID=UPI0028F6E1FD|nr:LysM peptidoglycan-binding domain-containing protein [Mesorhizobium sp. SP-1A]
MAVTPLKALLFAAGGSAALVGVAYVSGGLDPLFRQAPPVEVAALPQKPAAAQEPSDKTASGTVARVPATSTPDAGAMKPAGSASSAQPSSGQAAPEAAPKEAAKGVVAPVFDVVRVEGNGSMVVAGSAAPNSDVEVIHGATVLGSAKAGPDGAFAIILEDPLKPGDYQLVLRATSPDKTVATSEQTAVVSIPEKSGGQVLAMVEEPGKASEVLTMPKPEKKAEGAAATGQSAPATAPAPADGAAASPAPGSAEAAASQPAAGAQASAQPAPAANVSGPTVVVEAVEIDGAKIFVAGLADPGRKVRAYANDILLGDAVTSPDGHFLVEVARDLPVGEYTIRVDALDADGAKVIARAAVPFQREPGESIAAVAPSPQQKPSAAQGASGSAAAPAASQEEAAPQAQASAGSAVPETVSPKLQQVDGAVIIKRGDTLWHISRQVYGRGVRYSTIYLANQDQIRDPDRIWPGQVFKVPEKSREGEAADMRAMGDRIKTQQ